MAIVSNTGFYVFLSSCVKEGMNYVSSFIPRTLGGGWKIWEREPEKTPDKYCLEVDNLMVRDTMDVFELLIRKIRAVKGSLIITQASGKIKEVTDKDAFYEVALEDEMNFTTDDYVRCQAFDGKGVHGYHVKIEVDADRQVIRMPKEEFSGDDQGQISNPPKEGDEIVQFGNSSNRNRQSAIYIHADESVRPAVDVLQGINSKEWDNCVKLRLGGELPGEQGQVNGFYCKNGMLKALDGDTVIYEFSPDGSFSLGKGGIRYDPVTDQLTFGPNVTFSWDNLSSEAQANLKGEPGKDGANGTEGMEVKYVYCLTETSNPPVIDFDSDPGGEAPKGWTSTPQSLDSTNMYQWVSRAYKQNGRWDRFSAPFLRAKYTLDGDSSYAIDLSNENASVPCDYNGNAVGNIPSTRATVYCGTAVDTGWMFSAVYEGCGGTCDSSSGMVTVTALESDACTVILTASKTGCEDLRATYRLSKVKAGEPGTDAVVYWVEPSVNVVRKLKNGLLEPSVVSCTKMKQIGGADAVTTNEKILKYSLSNGTETEYEEAVSAIGTKWIDFILYDGTTVLDRERVPVIGDGVDGTNIRYLYKRTSDEETPDAPGSDDYAQLGWTEQPQGVTVEESCEWMCVIVKNEDHWEVFSSPVLWNHYKVDYAFLKEWSGKTTQIGSDYIVSPRMFSGTQDVETKKLTGVAIGRNMLAKPDGSLRTGMFGIKDGIPTFELDAETGGVTVRGSVAEVLKKFNQTTGTTMNLDFSTGFNWSTYNTTSDGTVVLYLPGDPMYAGTRCTVVNTGLYNSITQTVSGRHVEIATQNGGKEIRTNRRLMYNNSYAIDIMSVYIDVDTVAQLYAVLDVKEETLYWYLMNPEDFYVTVNTIKTVGGRYTATLISGGEYDIPVKN